MTVVFPKNNLPEPAQPWAREVQKQLTNVIASDLANEINNAARDNQLNSSLITLTKTVSDVKVASQEASDAINGLIGLGSTGSDYTLNASNIVGGTITGVTFRTAPSGQRVELSGTSISFYNDSIFTGTIFGSTVDSGSITIQSANGVGQLVAFQGSGFNGGAFVGTSTANYLSSLGDSYISGGTFRSTATTNIFNNSVSISGGFTASGRVFFTGIGTTTNAANVRVGTGGGSEIFQVTSSSKRFKNSIENFLEVDPISPKKLLEIPVVKFKYNNDYLNENDPRFNSYVPGFIAEDINEIYPIAVEIEENIAQDWNPRFLIPGMLALIQELYTRIETLENGAN
jgi:hypothetical protein